MFGLHSIKMVVRVDKAPTVQQMEHIAVREDVSNPLLGP